MHPNSVINTSGFLSVVAGKEAMLRTVLTAVNLFKTSSIGSIVVFLKPSVAAYSTFIIMLLVTSRGLEDTKLWLQSCQQLDKHLEHCT